MMDKIEQTGRVEGLVAIVTGAASGLGLADARALLAEGARVVLTDINAEVGTRLASELGQNAHFIRHDVSKEDDWKAVIAETVETFGKLNILVNNAGIVLLASPEETTLEDFRRINSVMTDGVFLGCKHAIPAMAKSGGGSIINMSSSASHLGYPIFFAYTAAKGAVRSMTKSIAIHCQDMNYGIRCNSIHPGAIETAMIQFATGRSAAEAIEVPKGVLPAGSVGSPEDVAAMVVYLASPESRFVTGAEFLIDNGLAARPAG